MANQKITKQDAINAIIDMFNLKESELSKYSVKDDNASFLIDKREFERFEVIDKLQEFFADKSIIDGQCRIDSLTFLYTSVKIENRGKEA